jgi:hypothetical protein
MERENNMREINEFNLLPQSMNLDVHDTDFWTNFFDEKAKEAAIFDTTISNSNFRTKTSSTVIGNKWLQFSILMPKVLCLLASKVDSNQARMRILKIAWEELGEGKVKHIHPETFKTCLSLADVEVKTIPSEAISQLERYAEGSFRSTAEIFGLGLGLEIIAVQNIETIFNGLAHDPIIATNLKLTEFFQIHFQNEEGHISHCIDSFIKYCPDYTSKNDFLMGFENGLIFWKLFWSEVADELASFNQQGVAWAN